MKKLTEDQIQLMFDRKEKFKLIFKMTALVAVVLNAFYFYELYRLGGEKTFILTVIEVINIVLSLGICTLFIGYLRNNVTDVSYFLWYMDSFLSLNKSWKYGEDSFMFVKQRRMYFSFNDLFEDVMLLKCCFSKYSYWAIFSVVLFLLFLLCNSIEVLFCGESAKIMMICSDNVAFYLFFIPKCIFALILLYSLFMFFYYKGKVSVLVKQSDKSVIIDSVDDFD